MESLARFHLTGEIGRGSEGAVHRGVDPTTQQPVAAKIFSARFESDDGELVLFRDLESLRAIDHPNVARILDVGIADRRPYVVTELIDGVRLDDEQLEASLTMRAKLDLAVAIADGLTFTHASSLLHSNLRPSNILVTADRVPKLVDFSLFELLSTSTDPAAQRGEINVAYRAPEQLHGQRTDERTDIFCLGAVVYELLLGSRPFEGATWIQIARRILHDAPRPIDEQANIPTELAHNLMRAMANNPLDRFQSMSDFQAALVRVRRAYNEPTGSGPASKQVASDTADPPAALTEAESLNAYLVVDEGERSRIVPLVSAELSIGRKGENDLPLMEEHISRRHCVVRREAGQFTLIDQESKHGTFRNGVRVARARLVEGDVIELGRGSRFRITFHASQHQPSKVSRTSGQLGRNDIEILLDVTFALNSSLSVDATLNIIMESALAITAAERGFIMLQDDDGHFTARTRRHINPSHDSSTDSAYSHTAVERCIASKEPLVIHDIRENSDLAQRASVVDLSLQSIMCLPLVYNHNVLGVLYLDSRELTTAFKSAQLDLLMAVASQAAVSLENARLYELATVDRLTGVYLRHHFDNRLQHEFRRAQRYESPLSLIFIDVDEFKKVNDTYGHPVGDRLLRAIAHKIRDASRNTDIVAKYGGDEFVLLAPESSKEMALVLAERVREDVYAMRDQVISGHTVSISVGVSTYPGYGIESVEDLVRVADDALLSAKKAGRNQVITGSGVLDRTGTSP